MVKTLYSILHRSLDLTEFMEEVLIDDNMVFDIDNLKGFLNDTSSLLSEIDHWTKPTQASLETMCVWFGKWTRFLRRRTQLQGCEQSRSEMERWTRTPEGM